MRGHGRFSQTWSHIYIYIYIAIYIYIYIYIYVRIIKNCKGSRDRLQM